MKKMSPFTPKNHPDLIANIWRIFLSITRKLRKEILPTPYVSKNLNNGGKRITCFIPAKLPNKKFKKEIVKKLNETWKKLHVIPPIPHIIEWIVLLSNVIAFLYQVLF